MRWPSAPLVLTLGLLCANASAQSRDPIAAEALFRAGRQSFEKGDYALALQRFDEAYRLDPTTGALLNRALAAEALGQLTRAWNDFHRVLERLDGADPRVEIARERLRALEGRLAWVTIELDSGAPAGTTVKRGDVELGAASVGVPLPFDAGRHELVVMAPGRGGRPYAVDLAEGQRLSLRVAPLAPQSPEGPGRKASVLVTDGGRLAARRPRSPQGPQQPASDAAVKVSREPLSVGYVLLGVGAVGIVVAGVSGAFLLDRISTVEDNCVDKLCNETGFDAGRSGRTWRAVAGVSLAVGVISAGVGGYLVLRSDRSVSQVAWTGTF